jgi:hypothetical protein
MNQRIDHETIGLAWVLRIAGWVALMGAVLLAAPIGLLGGAEAGMWALGAVATVALAAAWLGAEAVRAWREPTQEVVDSEVLTSRS